MDQNYFIRNLKRFLAKFQSSSSFPSSSETQNSHIKKSYNPPISFNLDKKTLIDYTYRRCQPAPTSFADLGGVWNVDGAYSFYTLSEYGANNAFLVDFEFTEAVLSKSKTESSLQLIRGNFGDESVIEQIGAVDAIFMFDVLLHQVKPDWDEILKAYSERTNYFVIYNQQWTGSQHTIRLLDLGREEYFRNVPPDIREHPMYKALFDKMYEEIHPGEGRIWRDISGVWQWGITDRELTETMENIGFKTQCYINYGRFGSLPNFENHAFVFQKFGTSIG